MKTIATLLVKRLFLTIVIVLIFNSTVAAGSFEDGSAAHVQKDYKTALQYFRPLADRGDARAQTALGLMFFEGEGVPQDYTKALSWFRKAADQGNSNAQTLLGSMFSLGKGVMQSHAEAVRWYRKAAD